MASDITPLHIYGYAIPGDCPRIRWPTSAFFPKRTSEAKRPLRVRNTEHFSEWRMMAGCFRASGVEVTRAAYRGFAHKAKRLFDTLYGLHRSQMRWFWYSNKLILEGISRPSQVPWVAFHIGKYRHQTKGRPRWNRRRCRKPMPRADECQPQTRRNTIKSQWPNRERFAPEARWSLLRSGGYVGPLGSFFCPTFLGRSHWSSLSSPFCFVRVDLHPSC